MSAEGKIITVFGSSRPREGDADYEEARALGTALARRGFRVCSGGYGGVMEAVSRGAKQEGGDTLAVTSNYFRSRANRWVDREIAVAEWQDRLFELIRLGDGFVACKGGTGTLVELAAVWEMLNKRVIVGKPFVALGDFWRPILERVREVELVQGSRGGEFAQRMVHTAPAPAEAAEFLAQALARAEQTSGSLAPHREPHPGPSETE
jgi:uncharacterized protein (TIGR00730 family)